MNTESRAERAIQPERLFREFSPQLTLRLAHGTLAGGEVGALSPETRDISEGVVTSFYNGQREARKERWQQEGMSFEQQMNIWLMGKDGRGGIAEWVRSQLETANATGDKDIPIMLKGVGLVANFLDQEMVNEYKNDPRLQQLMSTLGVSFDQLYQNNRYAEIFALHAYQQYLNNGEEGIKQFIDHLVQASLTDNASYDLALTRLEKVAPLMRIFGPQAEKAFAALAVAQLQLQHTEKHQELEKLSSSEEERKKPLGAVDSDVIAFLQAYPVAPAIPASAATPASETPMTPVIGHQPDEDEEPLHVAPLPNEEDDEKTAQQAA